MNTVTEPLTGNGLDPGSGWRIGTVILDTYEIRSVLGRGGMGIVYLARRIQDGELFAIKTLLASKIEEFERKRMFLQELRTWIDLPDHPNLAACRFFRTIGNRMAIFSEYVDGWSLNHLIRGRRVASVDTILDIAIQIAWGLAAAHQRRVIHQDIKPANILMSRDGVAKITDFGLSRVVYSAVPNAADADPSTESNQVTVGGMTLAFSSPEQALRGRVDFKTDMWSWGLTVLNMFTGKAQWSVGALADHVLDNCLAGKYDRSCPAIPPDLQAVFRRCFEKEPEDRWPDMLTMADRLVEIYESECHRPYPRQNAGIEAPSAERDHDRIIHAGSQWADPRTHLKTALILSGRGDTPVETLAPEPRGSRRARALVDLELFETAERILAELDPVTTPDAEREMAILLIYKSFVHQALDDNPGAVDAYDRAAFILERMMAETPEFKTAELLSCALQNKANIRWMQYRVNDAVDLYQRAIAVRDRVAPEVYADTWLVGRGMCQMNMGLAYMSGSRFPEALASVDASEPFFRTLADHEPDNPLYAMYLTTVDLNRSAIFLKMDRYRDAMECATRAIDKYRDIFDNRKEYRAAGFLMSSMTNRTLSLLHLDDIPAALETSNTELALADRLVLEEGREEYAFNQANALQNKGVIRLYSGDFASASETFSSSAAIMSGLVNRKGRNDLIGQLGSIYRGAAQALRGDTRYSDALKLDRQAIRILTHLAQNGTDPEWIRELAMAHAGAGESLRLTENSAEAVVEYQEGLRVMDQIMPGIARDRFLGDRAAIEAGLAYARIAVGDDTAAALKTAVTVLRNEADRTGRADLRFLHAQLTANR